MGGSLETGAVSLTGDGLNFVEAIDVVTVLFLLSTGSVTASSSNGL